MSTTSAQDRFFAEEMKDSVGFTIANSALENAIEWIASNLNPDDVFSDDQLESWAKSKGFTEPE